MLKKIRQLSCRERQQIGNTAGQVLQKRQWRIVELNGQGHRFWYVSILLQHLNELGLSGSAHLITRLEAKSTETWREHIRAHVESGLNVETTAESRREIILSTARRGTYLVVPDGDQWAWDLITARASIGPSLRGCILLMRPVPNAALKSRAKHIVKSILWRTAKTAHPGLSILSLVPARKSSASSRHVEDPIVFRPSETTREAWLKSQGADPNRHWLVVLGELSSRKCLKEIVAAISSASVKSAGWGLIAIGRADSETAYLLGKALRLSDVSVVYDDRFLTDSDFDTWISVADAVAVLHRNEGSSGVLLKCWVAGTPVLVGGARTVIDAAHSLHMESTSIERITPLAIAVALLQIVPGNRPSKVAHSSLAGRESAFADSLLGVVHR